jgi:hypothetical protein
MQTALKYKCQNSAFDDFRFIAYKLPKIHDSPSPNYEAGSGYAVITPSALDWTESLTPITHPASIVGKTLELLYTSANVNYILEFVMLVPMRIK